VPVAHAPPRTGTLVPPGADGLWRARVTKTHADGLTTRPLCSLGTADESLARRTLTRVNAAVAAGRDPVGAAELGSAPERVKDYAEAWLKKREAQGVVMARAERIYLEEHVLPAIGNLTVCDVRSSHVRGLLDDMASATYLRGGEARRYRRQTIAHARAVMHRLFDDAWRAEIIESNPVARVEVPLTREVRKERAILTDEEFSRFVACPDVDLELRMLALVARCEGGMRTGDLNAWEWTMIDRVHFAECFIPRAKTRTPQRLSIPDVLAPFLRAWWERAGRPESGPVFPARYGKRAGEARSPLGLSFAKRLRRALFRAGVYRMPPVEVPATSPGTRTDRGVQAKGTKLAPNPRDPLYYETTTTRPVDFHSFRRAFNTALAEAGVNVQHAMHLAAHGDAKTHMRYVMRTAAMRSIPDAALPPFLPMALLESSQPVTIHPDLKEKDQSFRYARRDSNPRPMASKATALSS
jgi:integrase